MNYCVFFIVQLSNNFKVRCWHNILSCKNKIAQKCSLIELRIKYMSAIFIYVYVYMYI